MSLSLQGLKVLVAEDDASLLRVLNAYLTSRGAVVTVAEDGQRAWEILQSQSFDLVLSDMQMPHLDGSELLDKIRAVDKGTPVFLFVTGQSQLSETEAAARGAAGLITKPFKFAYLLARIEDLVAKSAA